MNHKLNINNTQVKEYKIRKVKRILWFNHKFNKLIISHKPCQSNNNHKIYKLIYLMLLFQNKFLNFND